MLLADEGVEVETPPPGADVALRYVRDQIKATKLFRPLDLLADPEDPRDLFGMLQRAG